MRGRKVIWVVLVLIIFLLILGVIFFFFADRAKREMPQNTAQTLPTPGLEKRINDDPNQQLVTVSDYPGYELDLPHPGKLIDLFNTDFPIYGHGFDFGKARGGKTGVIKKIVFELTDKLQKNIGAVDGNKIFSSSDFEASHDTITFKFQLSNGGLLNSSKYLQSAFFQMLYQNFQPVSSTSANNGMINNVNAKIKELNDNNIVLLTIKRTK